MKIKMLAIRLFSSALMLTLISAFLFITGIPAGAAAPAKPRALDAAKPSPTPSLQVQVDPRVELLSVIFRLAGNPEYNQGKVTSYTDDVEKQFGSFRQHAVVKLARKLRQNHGVSYDACMSMAVHLTDTEELKLRVPLTPWPANLDRRWKPDDVDTFLKATRAFVKDTSFREFLDQHKALYRQTEARMKDLMDKESHLEWFADYFGERAGANFTIALALLNGGGSYGARCATPDGKQDLYCILGVWQIGRDGFPEFSRGTMVTVIHEFGHSYANPIVARHLSELQAAGNALYRPVAEKMRSQAYADGHTLLYESLVRACEVRYAARYDGAAAARSLAAYQKSRGFLWTEDLSNCLAEYEARRDQYPTLESFAPRLIAFFNDYAKGFAARQAALQAKRPRILWMTPTNGATQVDPGLTNLQVVFDRPMKNGSWALVGDAAQCPEGKGNPGYNANRTIWSVPVKLKPQFTYQFMLNSDSDDDFQSQDGVPLEPVAVTFTTGK